jgi:hypothetical protein
MKNLLDNPLVDLNGAFAAVASHMAAKMLFELLQTFILLGTLLSSYLLIPLCSFVCPVGALPICDFLVLLNLTSRSVCPPAKFEPGVLVSVSGTES